LFIPQHFTPPAVVSAQEKEDPPAAIATPADIPTTAVGAMRVVVVPSPTWPRPFPPQQWRPPSLTAHVWSHDASTAVTPLLIPPMSTGTMLQ
jgi:hypothetical protein